MPLVGAAPPAPLASPSSLVAPTITAGPTGSEILHRATFRFSGEAGAAFECRLGDGAFAPCTSPHALRDLPSGERRFEVRQRSGDGAVSAGAVREWTILPSPDPGYPLAPPFGHGVDAFSECRGGDFSLRAHNGDRYSVCLDEPGAHPWQRFAATATVEGDTATVTVTRESGDAPTLLGFGTGDGSATAGADYEPREGELFFAGGVTSRTIGFPVVRDPDVTSDRTFAVELRVVRGLRRPGGAVPGPIPGAPIVPPDPGGDPDPDDEGPALPGPGPGTGAPSGGEVPVLPVGPEWLPPVVEGAPLPPSGTPIPTPDANSGRTPVRMTTVRIELRFCKGCTQLSVRDRKRLLRLRDRVDGSRLLAIDAYGDRGRSRSANRRLSRSRARAVERALLRGVRTRPARRAVSGHDRLRRATLRAGRAADRVVAVRIVNRR